MTDHVAIIWFLFVWMHATRRSASARYTSCKVLALVSAIINLLTSVDEPSCRGKGYVCMVVALTFTVPDRCTNSCATQEAFNDTYLPANCTIHHTVCIPYQTIPISSCTALLVMFRMRFTFVCWSCACRFPRRGSLMYVRPE